MESRSSILPDEIQVAAAADALAVQDACNIVAIVGAYINVNYLRYIEAASVATN